MKIKIVSDRHFLQVGLRFEKDVDGLNEKIQISITPEKKKTVFLPVENQRSRSL